MLEKKNSEVTFNICNQSLEELLAMFLAQENAVDLHIVASIPYKPQRRRVENKQILSKTGVCITT